jgi:sulfoxide reductase heme-binding subunit YedZ
MAGGGMNRSGPSSGKRLVHHLILACLSGILTLTIFLSVESNHTMFRWSMASGYTGLALLGASLIIGPWNVLRGIPNPVNTNLRRDVGIWGGVMSIIHTVAGLQVHMSGKFWLYFVFPNEGHLVSIRYDLFGFANYTGLGIAIILLLLLSLSNDSSLRRLGLHRWKTLQRWNYAGFVLLMLHGAAYQFLERRAPGFIFLFAMMVLLVGMFQFSGFRRVNKGKGSVTGTSIAPSAR